MKSSLFIFSPNHSSGALSAFPFHLFSKSFGQVLYNTATDFPVYSSWPRISQSFLSQLPFRSIIPAVDSHYQRSGLFLIYFDLPGLGACHRHHRLNNRSLVNTIPTLFTGIALPVFLQAIPCKADLSCFCCLLPLPSCTLFPQLYTNSLGHIKAPELKDTSLTERKIQLMVVAFNGLQLPNGLTALEKSSEAGWITIGRITRALIIQPSCII